METKRKLKTDNNGNTNSKVQKTRQNRFLARTFPGYQCWGIHIKGKLK